MSSDIAIRIEKLGKQYRYGGAAPMSSNLRADITDWIKGMIRKGGGEGGTQSASSRPAPTGNRQPVTDNPSHHETLKEVHERHIAESPDYFWALKDINLEVKQGEVVGIIGRNGAGKSTLLKILSRITPPTTGRIIYRGRVASLLEVGTGFHRELTGRENIYLNGSILGMKRAEIARNFDKIVSFAGIEKFVDTPVKFFSSGMYVRLAFAVAAYLESEILLIDEVLAVGDAEFQKKCLGKMGEVARAGRTVVFVSHNMAALATLCKSAVVINRGSILKHADTSTAVREYLQMCAPRDALHASFEGSHPTRDKMVRFRSFHCETAAGVTTNRLVSGDFCRFVLRYECFPEAEATHVGVGIVINTSEGVRVTNLWNEYAAAQSFASIPRDGEFLCELPRLPLCSGTYYVDLFCSVQSVRSDWIEHAATFEVADGDYYRSGRVTDYTGCVFLDHQWRAVETEIRR